MTARGPRQLDSFRLSDKKPLRTTKSRKPAPPVTALVLSGGGARGAYECGVYASLYEHGIRPNVVVGTSVGAINAVAIAEGMTPDKLKEIWLNLAQPDSWLPWRLKKARPFVGGVEDVFKNRYDVWNFFQWNHLFETNPLLETVNKYFDVEKIRKSKVKLFVTAVDVVSGESSIFTNRNIMPEHVLASASIPIAFPWTEVDGRIYWDGGLLANIPPLKTAIDADRRVRDIYLVKLFPKLSKRPNGLLECIDRTIEIVLQGVLNNDIRQLEFINELIRKGVMKSVYREINLHTIEFHEPFTILSILDFSEEHVERLISQGKQDTDRYLNRLDQSRERKGRSKAARA